MAIEPSRPPPAGGSLAGGAAPWTPGEGAALSPLPSQRLPSPVLSISGWGGWRWVLGCWGRSGGPAGDFFGEVQGFGEVASAERSEARLSRWGVAGQVDQVQQLQAEAVATSTRRAAAKCCVAGFLCHKKIPEKEILKCCVGIA